MYIQYLIPCKVLVISGLPKEKKLRKHKYTILKWVSYSVSLNKVVDMVNFCQMLEVMKLLQHFSLLSFVLCGRQRHWCQSRRAVYGVSYRSAELNPKVLRAPGKRQHSQPSVFITTKRHLLTPLSQ